MATKNVVETAAATKTLIVTAKGDQIRKIEIPTDWIVTYGPIAVGARNMDGNSPNVLRIYSDAAKKDLKAVFRDVVSFTDETVVIKERVVKTKKKAFNRDEANGKQAYTAEIRKVTWRDPMADVEDDDDGADDLTEEALALPAAFGDDDIPL